MTTIGVLARSGKSLGGGLEELRERLSAAGFPKPAWCEVAKSRDAPGQVRRMLDSGVDRLVVWGGDGTVRRCIDTIVRDGGAVSLAILPAGTSNLLARGLGIPLKLQAALDVALSGVERAIDIGVVNGEAFAVMAGTGFDAFMIRDADDGLKDRLGRLAYVGTALRNLDAPRAAVRIKVDGRRWFDGRASCVLIGNVGDVLGTPVFPGASVDDGALDIGVLTAKNRRDWLRVATRAATGHVDRSPLVQIARGEQITIKLDRKLPWELDGGARAAVRKLTVSVRPRAVSVLVPHG